MPAFCQHTRKPLIPLSRTFPKFAGLDNADHFAISSNGVIYYLKARSVDYGPDYFLSEYESQYGKSYLEDEPNLRRLAASRLDWMDRVLVHSGLEVDWSARGPTLLEIGSAAGFFLDEAKQRGYRTLGVEISRYASEIAQRKGHQILNASFASPELFRFLDGSSVSVETSFADRSEIEESALFANGLSAADASLTADTAPTGNAYSAPADHNPSNTGNSILSGGETAMDLLAAFYTLEHFPDQQLTFRRMAQLLKPGGLLLLSLPSYHGPLFRCSPEKWLSSHPEDHFADYSPESMALTLELYGLKQIASRPSSFHRKRACGWIRYMGDSFYRKWAMRKGFGDTMDILAVKSL
ncbi:MAG: methyltransferase domain-containing protein [Leptospiraceae bacterium]